MTVKWCKLVAVVHTWHTNYSIVYSNSITTLATLTPLINAMHFYLTCCKLDRWLLSTKVRLPNCFVSNFLLFSIAAQLHLDPIVPAVTFGIVTSWKTKRATTTLHLVAQLRIATLMTLEGDALCRHIQIPVLVMVFHTLMAV